MLRRYSSRRASLYKEFLKQRLAGARRYHRIAGYFQSSLLERVDIYYLIHCVTIVEHDENSLCSLGVEEKGVKAYEGFALARQLMNRTVYYHRAVQVFEFMMEELLRQVISEFNMLHRDSELRTAIPPYLSAVAGLCDSTIHSTDAFIAANWRNYFALSEPDIWHLVTSLAAASSTKVPRRARMLAEMLLKRENFLIVLFCQGWLRFFGRSSSLTASRKTKTMLSLI
jgi:hypothetical protein